jgi:hypothetical protein
VGSENITPPFFTSALDGSEYTALHPGRFSRGERAPVLGGPQSQSAHCEEEICPYRKSNLGRPARRPTIYSHKRNKEIFREL